MHVSGNEYRYEIEQWSKVVAVGSNLADPDSWIEYLPDGTIQKYGSTTVIIVFFMHPVDESLSSND